jgi:tRNA (cmo5U34)-methyltransferase
MNKSVESVFNNAAADYDRQRRKLIPCFDDFYGIATSLAVSKSDAPSILDLGAGTGLFSSYIISLYPDSKLTLVDFSEAMLSKARERFSGMSNIKYIAADYLAYEFNETYDIIISALSIHHLSGDEKRALYKKCFGLLNPQGVFINADQVLGETEYLENLYRSDWSNKIEASGLSREELDSAYERVKADKMSNLHDQLEWLKSSGFSDVDCVYKYYSFVVLTGRKL